MTKQQSAFANAVKEWDFPYKWDETIGEKPRKKYHSVPFPEPATGSYEYPNSSTMKDIEYPPMTQRLTAQHYMVPFGKDAPVQGVVKDPLGKESRRDILGSEGVSPSSQLRSSERWE